MKKIVTIILLAFTAMGANAQLVEYYENPQRFQFTPFNHNCIASINWCVSYPNYGDTIFFSKKCTRNSQNDAIYGLAFPIIFYQYYDHDTNELLNKLLIYYDTSNGSAFIANESNIAGYEYSLLAKTSLRIGESSLIGNYFKMPDSDSAYFSNVQAGLYFHVLETYFDHPVRVEERFLIGLNLKDPSVNYEYANPLSVALCYSDLHTFFPGSDTLLFSHIVDSFFVNPIQNNTPYLFGWGAPFPILTPPPCMPPIWLTVTEQHRQSATIQWRAQYSNTHFEVEYGPRGFAEGTGTTVGPITPDAQYKGQITLNGLTMDADYTVRVRSYCTSGSYSDWTELDFHTDAFFIVDASTNNDEWGFVVGTGEYLSGTTAQLFAYPRSETHPFLNWSDGSNQNPRTFTVTRDTSFLAIFGNVGINSICAHSAITVAPNPTSSEVAVRSDSPIASWTLYDIQGRTIATGQPNSTSATVDLRSLQPAVYIIAVRTATGTSIKSKIIKQ